MLIRRKCVQTKLTRDSTFTCTCGRRIGCARTEYVYVFVYVANGKDHGTVRCTSVDAWLEHDHGIYPNECTFYLHCLSSYADIIKIWMDDEHDVCFAFLTTVQ